MEGDCKGEHINYSVVTEIPQTGNQHAVLPKTGKHACKSMLVLMRFIVINNEYPLYTYASLRGATCSCTAFKSSNGNKERYVMDRWCVRDFVRGSTHVVLFSNAELHSAQQCRHSNAITP